jgi:hypothetical protein
MYDFINKLCKTQTEVILYYIIPNVRGIGQGKPGIGSIRGLNLAAVRATTFQLTDSE